MQDAQQDFFRGTMITDEECTVAGTVIRSKGKVTMSGDTAAHFETQSTFTPPLYGRSETIMIIDQKYVGACPAGVVPGDMIGTDGTVRHLWHH